MKLRATSAAVGVSCVCLSVALSADTLVLRDGRRVQGDLVAIRDGIVEFDGQTGFRRERMRIDRADVLRIEFDAIERDRGGDPNRDDPRGGRPSGLRERDVSVDSWIPWKDTGVDVRAGQVVYFSASGRVRWGPNRQDGPEGEHNSPRNETRPIPSRPAAALIGRVGDGNEIFFIGDDSGPIRMRSSGRLYLGINDDYLRDNSGSFRVTVYY
ncbi:MAG TPA: hypothetical protein VGY57_03490 [Vicinamibacterales bacterium]|nr:hypothetical protein [Vicinamibacterales bacterium]